MKRIYIAYGSNMNLEQMHRRCPSAVKLGTGVIGWELKFFRGGYADIIPSDTKKTPVVVWDIKKMDEMSLDQYEGYPKFYRKEENITVKMDDGQVIEGMAYIMNNEYKYPTIPRLDYYITVFEGYHDNGIDYDILEEALRTTEQEVALYE